MAVSIPSLRRWFAAAAIMVLVIVAGVYFYARHRMQNALKQIPDKIGLEVQQSATGFTVSKSDQGRTIFKIEASKAVQFKQGGHAELHDVAITIYGRDSARYDRIYGSEFDYNQQSGDITARGQVQIDLEANPEGVFHPDQSPPAELKNPIHLTTNGLVFNQKTGNAYTRNKVQFELPRASGSATGMDYVAKTNVLTLESDVEIRGSGLAGPTVSAEKAVVAKNPHQVLLAHPHVETIGRKCDSETATLFLRSDNTLDRVLASGNVSIEATMPRSVKARADQMELTITPGGGLRAALLSGTVHAEVSGDQPIQAAAGRVQLDFSGQNVLKRVRAEQAVKIAQPQRSSDRSNPSQLLQIAAPLIDFFLENGSRLSRAEIPDSGEISMVSISGAGPETVVTAGRFHADFTSAGEISSVHGSPDARIVSRNAGQADRISTSQALDARFHSGRGIESIIQERNVVYTDGERKAWGDHASYTPSDQILVLSGSPRVVERGMTTTAQTMRLNRVTGDALAEGGVKTTYSDLKPEPNGALLASSSPIHVTAREMSVRGNAGLANYTGGARLWQDANTAEAPSIEFDRERRSMVAQGTSDRRVSTVLVQVDKDGTTTPIDITASRLTYTDSERKAHFDGDVIAKSADATISAAQIDAFLQARGQTLSASGGKLDRIVAIGQVVITQPDRRATGDQLVYTVGDDKFVLTGGPPSIFDAEHGKITGVSLTFFRRDDRVLVEGNNKFPTVTQTRVAR